MAVRTYYQWFACNFLKNTLLIQINIAFLANLKKMNCLSDICFYGFFLGKGIGNLFINPV